MLAPAVVTAELAVVMIDEAAVDWTSLFGPTSPGGGAKLVPESGCIGGVLLLSQLAPEIPVKSNHDHLQYKDDE